MLRRSTRGKNAFGDLGHNIPANLAPAPLKTDVAHGTNTAAKEDQSDTEEEAWDDEEDEDSDKSSEEEDSDYESKRQSKSTPAKKKAKTSHSKPVKSTRRISLSLLVTMPLDILFEIFSHLSPRDIVNLSRTSKTLHGTLSSRTSMALWKAARERGSIPDGPEWMSEAAWANLVFGSTCQSCGTNGVHNVDFHLLKRVCLACKKKHYVLRSKVEKRYPDADFVILDLVPSTNVSAWSSYARSSYYYWDQDLESMISKLASLKDGSTAQELTSFMGEQKRRRIYIGEHASSWLTWYEKMKSDRSQQVRDAESRRLRQVQDRFKELGYMNEDLNELSYKNECRGKAQLTDKIWNRIRPILEPGVKERRVRRLERELASIKHTRRQILTARYNDFQRTLQPSQWRYLPRSLEISVFEPFARHVDADVEVEVNRASFDDGFSELPNLLAAAAEQRKTTLRAQMSDTIREEGEIGLDPLDLATAVFKCAEAHYFSYVFGWDEIASHHCLCGRDGSRWNLYVSTLKTTPAELKYDPRIANVVRKLAQLTGLDAATATAADFDEKNLRFRCEACVDFRQSGQYYRFGYSWRDLAMHLDADFHNPQLLISVFSDHAANELKECERNDDKWSANLWTCSHCPEYFDDLQSRQTVKQHLSSTHGIQTPSEPTDYFFFERYRKEWRSKPKFVVPAPTNPAPVHAIQNQNPNQDLGGKFRCLVCLTNGNRLFILKGVEDHLRAKHSVSGGTYGVHYAPA